MKGANDQVNYEDLLNRRKFNPDKEPPAESIVFFIDSKNIGSLQNFNTITGMQKSGKTTFITAMIAAALTNTMQLGMRIRLPEDRRRVGFFDTEQGETDFWNTVKRIKAFIPGSQLPDHFHAYNVREDDPPAIIWMIKTFLAKHPDCSLLVIDGILDLIDSYNDERESKKLINFLKQITKAHNLLALLTLHKGKTTSNTLGHLGSMADRAAQSIIVIEKIKERNTFVMKADYLRSADDFNPIEIYFDKGNHKWEQTDYVPPEEKDNRQKFLKPGDIHTDVHRNNVFRLFTFEDEQGYEPLVQNISELYARGINWSKDCLTHLVREGIVFKTQRGSYSCRQQTKLFITPLQ